MQSKQPKRNNYFTREFWVAVCIIAAVLLFIFALIRIAHGLKTQEVEFKTPAGSYDGKVVYSRTDDLSYLNTSLLIEYDLTALGGINVGSATGAATGELKSSSHLMSGAGLYLANNNYIRSGTSPVFGGTTSRTEFYAKGTENSIQFMGKSPYPLWLTLDADSADFTQNITATDKDISALSFTVGLTAPSLPSASATYRGKLVLKIDATDTEPDQLYICLRGYDGSNYSWVLICEGTPWP